VTYLKVLTQLPR